MLKIAWKRFISSFHIHFFVIVQLSIVFSICLIMVSSVYSRFAYYLPLQNLMNRNASAIQLDRQVHGGNLPKDNYLIFYRELDSFSKSFPDKANTWYARYSPLIASVEQAKQKQVFLSYTENTWSLHSPDMASGNWREILSAGLTENGNIPVIVYPHHTEYQIGDTLQVKKVITYETDTQNPDTVTLEICGILEPDAMLFGGIFGDGVHNHTSFWASAEDLISDDNHETEGCVFVMSQELLDSIDVAAEIFPCNAIITYDDTLTQKQVVINTERIHNITGLPAENIASIRDFSLLYIMQQVYTLMPLFICIAILALISSICTSAVITKKNLHSYAVFHLCGASSGKCVFVCSMQTVLVSIASLLLTACTIVFVSRVTKISILFNFYSFLLCIIILVMHLLLTTLLPAHMLKEDSLKNLL